MDGNGYQTIVQRKLQAPFALAPFFLEKGSHKLIHLPISSLARHGMVTTQTKNKMTMSAKSAKSAKSAWWFGTVRTARQLTNR